MKLSLTLDESWALLVVQHMLLPIPDTQLAHDFLRQVHRGILVMSHQEGAEQIVEVEIEASEGDLWLLATTVNPLMSLKSTSHEGKDILFKVFTVLAEETLRQEVSEPVKLTPWLQAQLEEATNGDPSKNNPDDSADHDS